MTAARSGLVVLLLLAAGVGVADLVNRLDRGAGVGPEAGARAPAAAVAEARSPAVRVSPGPAPARLSGDDVGAGESADAVAAVRSPRDAPRPSESRRSSPAAVPEARPVEPFTGPAAVSARRPVPRASLGGRVRSLLRHDHLKKAAVGLAVFSVTHGESLLRIDAATPRIPASNAKLVTTAAVLTTLGRSFAFETRLVALGDIDADGVLEGDLVVAGDGDPDPRELEGEPLADRLAAAARAAGLVRVTGRLIVDDRRFDREAVSPGWRTQNLHKAYSAPVSAFSSRGNTLAVEVEPAAEVGRRAAVSLAPPGPPFELDASVETAGANAKHLIDVRPMPAAPGRIVVRGRTPHGADPVPVEVAVTDPSLVAGERLRAALRRAGVEVEGPVVLAPRDLEVLADRPLAAARTPLAPLLRVLNKESSNVVAEHLFKRLGYAHEGLGSFASGGRAVRAALERLGLEWRGSSAADGSGLSRDNRYGADLLVSLLDRLYRSSSRDLLLDSLAVAGVDGTLRRRLSEPRYRGRVRGKTGYVSRVSSVSGFAQTDDGEVLAFSILMNGFTGWAGHMRAVQDDVLRLLCDLEAP